MSPALISGVSARRGPGETVAYLDEPSMLRGFVIAFATACADGVPVHLRGSVRNYQVDGRSHSIDERALRRERLRREVAEERQLMTNAVNSALKAKDAMVVAMMTERADAHAQQLRQLERQLEQLETLPEPPEPVTFEAATEVLLAALANIVNQPRLSLEEHAAFRALVPNIRLEPCEDGTWIAEALVHLPVADGLAEVGPIRWRVSCSARGTSATRARRASSRPSGTRAPRHQLRQALEDVAGLAPEAACLLTATPFAELPHLVLHTRARYELPEWVGAEWRRGDFLDHVDAVYGVTPGHWAGPRLYGRRMPRAQAVVDCAADAGRLTLAGFRQTVPGVDANDMWVFARWEESGGRKRGPVVDKHVEDDGTWSLSTRRCRCGRPALIVAHAPEIPGSLLCECGLAVDAPPGSTADGLVFPSAYGAMRVPRAQWMRDLRRTSGQIHDELCEVSARQARILEILLRDRKRAWLPRDLAPLAGMSAKACQWNLDQLRRREFVQSDGRPATFVLVDPDATRAVLARSTKRRTTASGG